MILKRLIPNNTWTKFLLIGILNSKKEDNKGQTCDDHILIPAVPDVVSWGWKSHRLICNRQKEISYDRGPYNYKKKKYGTQIKNIYSLENSLSTCRSRFKTNLSHNDMIMTEMHLWFIMSPVWLMGHIFSHVLELLLTPTLNFQPDPKQCFQNTSKTFKLKFINM